MKYYWELSQNNEIIMQNTLVLNLRELYFSCINSENDLEIKQQRLALTQKLENQSKVKLKSGLISQMDADEASDNRLKSQSDINTAKRDRENALFVLNSFIGASVKIDYGKFTFIEQQNITQLKAVDYYIEQALKNRMDLSDLQKQIDLNKLEMKVMEINRVNEIYSQARIDYGSLVNGTKTLEAKVIQTTSDIEAEIRSAYSDIKKANDKILNIKKAIESKERKLTQTKVQYRAGKISDSSIGELQIEINELKDSYNMEIYNYNTKILKLVNATGFGPKY
jgi:outer membrane protein TolC